MANSSHVRSINHVWLARVMVAPPDANPAETRSVHAVAPATQVGLRVLQVGDVELEIDAHRVRVAGQPVHLPPREFQMLSILMGNAGRVVGRRELIDALWGPDHRDTSKTLETHINRLRDRIKTPDKPRRIRTVHGQGYIFDLPDSPSL